MPHLLCKASQRRSQPTALPLDNFVFTQAKSLYGLSMAKMTHTTMLDVVPGRPFILSRSTYPGAGAYASHWTGDNAATWDDLRWSVSTMLTTGLVGIPHIGGWRCGNDEVAMCCRMVCARNGVSAVTQTHYSTHLAQLHPAARTWHICTLQHHLAHLHPEPLLLNPRCRHLRLHRQHHGAAVQPLDQRRRVLPLLARPQHGLQRHHRRQCQQCGAGAVQVGAQYVQAGLIFIK